MQDCKKIEQLINSLEWLLDASDTEPGMDIYKAHKDQFRELIKQVKA